MSQTYTSVGGVQKVCMCVNGGKTVFEKIKAEHFSELKKYEPFI